MKTSFIYPFKKEPDLLSDPVPGALLSFSAPFMLSTLLQTLYATADTVIVGQCLGSRGLSAVSNASLLMQMLYMLCVGFASAGQIMIAQAVGAGHTDSAQETIDNLLFCEVLLSLITGLGCITFATPLIRLLGTPDEARTQAVYYVVICGIGMIFTGLYNMFSAILRGYGDSRHPLLFVVIASIVNIFLDLLFVGLFHWNVAGAALATVIGQMLSVWFSFRFCGKSSAHLGFTLHFRTGLRNRENLMQLMKLGVPLALQTGAVQFSFLFVTRMVNSVGLTFSAAFGVAQKIRNIPGILSQGLNMGCSSMIGQNWGAGNKKRVSQIVNWGILYCALVHLAFGVLFMTAPVLCFRMFTAEVDVLAYASLCMLALVLERPGMALMAPCTALVNAQGFVHFSIIVGLVDAFVGRVLLCWLFGIFLHMGPFGFLLGYVGGTYLTAIPTFFYYLSGLWKRRSVLT